MSEAILTTDGTRQGHALGPEARDGDERTLTQASEIALPIEARAVEKEYPTVQGDPLRILRGVDFEVAQGEAVAIVGASGSGKSTLLHILGGLDRPSTGRVTIEGAELATLNSDALAELRNRKIGFVFQFHHLLRDFTAQENVMMPALIAGDSLLTASQSATTLLEQVGLGSRLSHKPFELSGGEQQRVAVARALVNRPVVVLADEPTGNLDMRASHEVQELLFRLKELHGVALVVVTHNRQLASRADRVLGLREGILEDA